MKYLFILSVFFISIQLHAQIIEGNLDLNDPYQKHVVITVDSNKYVGRVTQLNKDSLSLKMNGENTIHFLVANVEKILVYAHDRKFQKGQESDFTDESHIDIEMIGHEKYFVSNSAFTLGQGQLAYRNIDVVYNSLCYGVTDYWTIGGSIYPFGLHTKLGAELIPNVHTAIYSDVQVIESNTGYVNLGAVVTLGKADNNVSISSTTALSFLEPTYNDTYHILSLAASLRILNRFGLMADVNLFTEKGTYIDGTFDVFSLGLTYKKENERWVFGGNFFTSEDTFVNHFTLPFVSFFTIL